jgi:hypothetical protein
MKKKAAKSATDATLQRVLARLDRMERALRPFVERERAA